MAASNPTLKHVLTWNESQKSWVYIKAEEAATVFKRSVQAHERIFICELCGQSVSLTQGGSVIAHFRHDRAEDIKNCPERADISASADHAPDAFSLPLKLEYNASAQTFSLYLGLIFPTDLPTSADRFFIDALNKSGRSYVQPDAYCFSRYRGKTIGYERLMPADAYRLTVPTHLKTLLRWPETVTGVSLAAGTVFDGITGKRIPADGDIEVGKDYLLLIDRWSPKKEPSLQQSQAGLHVEELPLDMANSLSKWGLFRIRADANSFTAAAFFMAFGLRLTNEPVQLFPLWPLTVKRPYTILSRTPCVHFFAQGKNTRNHMLPGDDQLQGHMASDVPHIVTARIVPPRSLLSAGRRTVLKYTFLEQRPLPETQPEVNGLLQWQTVDEEPVSAEALTRRLPQDTLIVNSAYDGCIEEYADGTFITRQELSGTRPQVLSLTRGHEFRFYIGLDLCASFVYFPSVCPKTLSSRSLRRSLSNADECRPIPHAALRKFRLLLGSTTLTRSFIADGKLPIHLIRHFKHHG